MFRIILYLSTHMPFNGRLKKIRGVRFLGSWNRSSILLRTENRNRRLPRTDLNNFGSIFVQYTPFCKKIWDISFILGFRHENPKYFNTNIEFVTQKNHFPCFVKMFVARSIMAYLVTGTEPEPRTENRNFAKNRKEPEPKTKPRNRTPLLPCHAMPCTYVAFKIEIPLGKKIIVNLPRLRYLLRCTSKNV